ncbi:hypothetical protein SKAU_G00358780 [Synaphobranchus kaupii]|uniref:Chemokine interleukin-8-like domain-containing protein n=1 Tax=Synaphobranchus kaupii TaxID=118154 RepID=A0A9Q1IGP3_SYNKA|nr:hypothetical protein SKAU_G00358780 [Synaphobranchus kaupii]
MSPSGHTTAVMLDLGTHITVSFVKEESRAADEADERTMEKSGAAGTAFRAAALLLLVLVLCSYATASTERALDCCLSTKNKQIPRRIVKSHSIQTVANGCAIPATLFITKKGKILCAPLASRSRWVAKLIKNLQRETKPKQKNGKKMKRTQRVATAH